MKALRVLVLPRLQKRDAREREPAAVARKTIGGTKAAIEQRQDKAQQLGGTGLVAQRAGAPKVVGDRDRVINQGAMRDRAIYRSGFRRSASASPGQGTGCRSRRSGDCIFHVRLRTGAQLIKDRIPQRLFLDIFTGIISLLPFFHMQGTLKTGSAYLA